MSIVFLRLLRLFAAMNCGFLCGPRRNSLLWATLPPSRAIVLGEELHDIAITPDFDS
ncbi:MAG: hypothetical protein KY476_00415 [Planctomycetes bacterium]|nr:hypothetical protein [Planctomycetota bacterium]